MSGRKDPAKNTAQILVAEDSPTQAETLRYILEQNPGLVMADFAGLPRLSLSIGLAQFDPTDPICIIDLLEPTDGEIYTQKKQKRERGGR